MSTDTKLLTVGVHSRELIPASDPSLPLSTITPSNLDYISGTVPTQLFTIYSSASFSAAVAALRRSLPAFLNHFFPFTGRVLPDPLTALPLIHCNNAGAELVVAHADLPLALVPFHDLSKSLDLIKLPYAEEIALSIQAVGFPCGGFSIMWGTNHLMTDGRTFVALPNLWAEFVRTNALSIAPSHDRSVFPPRSPPRFSDEIARAYVERDPEGMINVLSASAFVRRLYCVDAAAVERLRRMSSRPGGRKATRLDAVSAYVWKSLAAVVGDDDEKCRIVWWVDWRQRLGRPELGRYMGNVVSSVTKEAKVVEIVGGSYADVADRVAETVNEGTRDAAEHVQQQVDWMEDWKRTKGAKKAVLRVLLGLGSPTVVITSFHNLKMDMDFGMGKPGLVTPHILSGRFGRGFMVVSPRLKSRDGGFVLCAYLWRQLAEAMERDGERVVRLATPESLGLVEENSCDSRM